MEKFTSHSGTCAAIDLANIDTDQIIPKQFLKRIERSGYGEFLFFDWRFDPQGGQKANFVLNDPRYKDASILVAGANFGCGSSREHAPWSILDHGFRVVIAPSFADIFYNNSLKTGLLPIRLSEPDVRTIMQKATADPQFTLNIDLEEQSVIESNGLYLTFEIDGFRKYCLLNGLDDIGLSLQHEKAISAFEARQKTEQPFLGV